MIIRQSQLEGFRGTGPAHNGCGQVAIANLLGLPFETVRGAFDSCGFERAGRKYGTDLIEMQAAFRFLGFRPRRTFFRLAKRRGFSLKGRGVLLVVESGTRYHYVAFADGIVQDSARFSQQAEYDRRIKGIIQIETGGNASAHSDSRT